MQPDTKTGKRSCTHSGGKSGTPGATKQSLSQSKVRLVERMQSINFGCIEGLVVRNGEPILDPPPSITYEIKFDGKNGPRPEVTKVDFTLKTQVRELFVQMAVMGSGTIKRLEIKHGLPFKMTVEEVSA